MTTASTVPRRRYSAGPSGELTRAMLGHAVS